MNFGELRLRDVALELQQLELDLQIVAFADVAGFVTRLADVHGVLKALHVFYRQIESGFGELHADELLRHIESEGALVIGHGGFRLRGGVLGGLQAVLALPSAFEQVRNAHIKLHDVVDVVGGKVVRLKDRQELSVRRQHWIWPQVRGDLLRLILLDRGLCGLQIVIVFEGQLDGFIQRQRTAP